MKKIALLFVAFLALVGCKKHDLVINPIAEKDGTVFFYSGTYDPPNIYNQNGIYNGDGKVFYHLDGSFHSPATDLQVRGYDLTDDVLKVSATSVYTGSTSEIWAIKTKINYNDYGVGSDTDHNQFNGLYYCPQENFLYALDYNKGFITIYFLSSKTRLEKPFTWNDGGAHGPEIGFLMDDHSAWYISYQSLAPSPMTGIYQLRIADNGTVSTRQLFMMIGKE
jgi:hypothetical protein